MDVSSVTTLVFVVGNASPETYLYTDNSRDFMLTSRSSVPFSFFGLKSRCVGSVNHLARPYFHVKGLDYHILYIIDGVCTRFVVWLLYWVAVLCCCLYSVHAHTNCND